jgi:uncharacterized protein (TIGR02588 family)
VAKTKSESAGTSPLEWFAAAIGLILLIFTFLVIGREAMMSETDQIPTLETKVVRIVPISTGFVVEFEAVNRSSATAAAVEIEGVLGDPSHPAETSGATLDYVAGDSSARGGLVFRNDPRKLPLAIRARGYQTP